MPDLWYNNIDERSNIVHCNECGYCWKGEGDDFPFCHYEGYLAPCEADELTDEGEEDWG